MIDLNQKQVPYHPNIADILYGSYIKYDKMYEMTKYAFYGKTDSNDVNIYIDAYSILRSLYTRGTSLEVVDSYVIASSIINLAIHLRAYFDSRHQVASKIYIIYGGARPNSAFSLYNQYNERNIIMENSNQYLQQLIKDNMEVIKILCPYLYDIFAIVDYENEFSVIASNLIDKSKDNTPNIIYSKDQLAYQLVAFKPYTFLYRPKKVMNADSSWVVTKSTLYNAYRYGELGLTKQVELNLDVKAFSIYQSISGVKSRTIPSIKNANVAGTLLQKSIEDGLFAMGYNANSISNHSISPFFKMFDPIKVNIADLINRFLSIDLENQTMIYSMSPSSIATLEGVINLYNPQEVRNINDKYFQMYPIDLNRV